MPVGAHCGTPPAARLPFEAVDSIANNASLYMLAPSCAACVQCEAVLSAFARVRCAVRPPLHVCVCALSQASQVGSTLRFSTVSATRRSRCFTRAPRLLLERWAASGWLVYPRRGGAHTTAHAPLPIHTVRRARRGRAASHRCLSRAPAAPRVANGWFPVASGSGEC